MIPHHLLLAQAEQIPTSNPVILTSITLCSAGTLALLIWLFRCLKGNPLKNTPDRRNLLPGWFAPAQLMFWLIAMVLLSKMITLFIPEAQAARRELTIHLSTLILELLIITIILAAGYFGFARRLKGFGLNLKTLPKDIPWAAVNLLAVWPLIEAALLLTLFIGKFVNPEFSIEVHQSLLALGDYPQWWMRAAIIVSAVLVVPVFEELLFRGLLQTTVRSHTRMPWVAIIATSILFSMLHPPTHWFAMTMLSVGLGYAYEKSGSLFRCICMHILFNGFVVTMTLLFGSTSAG